MKWAIPDETAQDRADNGEIEMLLRAAGGKTAKELKNETIEQKVDRYYFCECLLLFLFVWYLSFYFSNKDLLELFLDECADEEVQEIPAAKELCATVHGWKHDLDKLKTLLAQKAHHCSDDSYQNRFKVFLGLQSLFSAREHWMRSEWNWWKLPMLWSLHQIVSIVVTIDMCLNAALDPDARRSSMLLSVVI